MEPKHHFGTTRKGTTFFHLTILRHENTKTAAYKLAKNDWVRPFFGVFRFTREKSFVTVAFDHPVKVSGMARLEVHCMKRTKNPSSAIYWTVSHFWNTHFKWGHLCHGFCSNIKELWHSNRQKLHWSSAVWGQVSGTRKYSPLDLELCCFTDFEDDWRWRVEAVFYHCTFWHASCFQGFWMFFNISLADFISFSNLIFKCMFSGL